MPQFFILCLFLSLMSAQWLMILLLFPFHSFMLEKRTLSQHLQLCTHLVCQKDLKLVTKTVFWFIRFLIFTYTSNLLFLDNLLFPLIDWALKASTAQVISKTVHMSLPIPTEKEYCFLWLKVWPFWAVYPSQPVPQFNECPMAYDFASKATQEKRSSVSLKYF